MLLQLQQPDKFSKIIAELDEAGSAWSANHPEYTGPYTEHLAQFFQSNPPVPLLSSTISETLRYCSDSYSMRGVLVEEVTLGGYVFKKDDTLICRTRSVHRDNSEFENADQWVPARFVSDDGGKNTEGSHKWMPYGGGISICSGMSECQLLP